MIEAKLNDKEQATVLTALLFFKLALDEQRVFTDEDVETVDRWAGSKIMGANSIQDLLGKLSGKSITQMDQLVAAMITRDAGKVVLFEPHFNDE